jgi:hypothetical protein
LEPGTVERLWHNCAAKVPRLNRMALGYRMKSQSLIRKYAAIAHDRELSAALHELRGQFERWEQGTISAAELNDLIHEFHQVRSRDIWAKYATNHLKPALAIAVANGILRRDELPAELLQYLGGAIAFYEAEQPAS